MPEMLLEDKLNRLFNSTKLAEEFFKEAVHHIYKFKPYYDWVGVYRLSNDELILPADWFVGLEPEHQRIQLHEGICGAAASGRKTIVVDDVRSDPRYLACSIATRSEIVVPIQWRNNLYGVLDLDSDTPAAFNTDDVTLLQDAAEILAYSFRESEDH